MGLPSINDLVLYKTRNKWGDVMDRKTEKRVVFRLFRNNKGAMLIEWRGPRGQGACMPSTWNDWCDDVDENKRRGLTRWSSAV
jgi:hypothetical protein